MPHRGKAPENGVLVPYSTHLHELCREDEERLESLFVKLDKDCNGKIDILDLSEALKDFDLHHGYAKKFLERSDRNRSGDISLADFLEYVREHEKNLKLHFSSLDTNKDDSFKRSLLNARIKCLNFLAWLSTISFTSAVPRPSNYRTGKIDLEELIKAFSELGIPLEKMEATNLLQRMDQDGSLNISYDEWRDFLLLAPSQDIQELINYWRHSTYLDIGEDMNVPDDFTPSEMKSGMWWRHLAAGGVAGAVSRTCTAPLDRLKIFLQVQPSRQKIVDCMRLMLTEGGVKGLWRGNGINVLKIAPESAIKFAAYEHVKRFIKGDNKQALGIYERFVAGALAGGISQTAIYPLEVLKTRLALRKTGQFSGIADAAYKIYSLEGLRSFYRGYIPNILGIVPYAGIDLAVYETLKRKYLRSHASHEQPSFYVLLACGSASSTLGQVCSYPLALVRTRLQAQVVTPTMDRTSMTMTRVFRTIIEREGVLGLYRGIAPNFIKVMPAVSISYVVYEYSSRILGVNMT